MVASIKVNKPMPHINAHPIICRVVFASIGILNPFTSHIQIKVKHTVSVLLWAIYFAEFTFKLVFLIIKSTIVKQMLIVNVQMNKE